MYVVDAGVIVTLNRKGPHVSHRRHAIHHMKVSDFDNFGFSTKKLVSSCLGQFCV